MNKIKADIEAMRRWLASHHFLHPDYERVQDELDEREQDLIDMEWQERAQ